MTVINNFSELDLTKTYTYADYVKWQFEERIELIRGFVFSMSPAPNLRHQHILGNLSEAIRPFFKKHSCNAFFAPVDVVLPIKDAQKQKNTTVVQPDFIVVCDTSKCDDKRIVGAPDWVIEILSPGNSPREMRQKYGVYEESGVREYWIVQPEYDNIIMYVLHDQKFVYNGIALCEDIVSPAIFPDLKLVLQDVFEA